MNKGFGILALGLSLVPMEGLAAESTAAVTVSATSGACLGSIAGGPVGKLPPGTSFLMIQNTSPTDNVAFALGYSALPVASLHSAGSFTLPPASLPVIISDPNLAGSYLACIGTGSDPVTIIISSQSSTY